VVEQAQRFEGVRLQVEGATTEERCAALLALMLRAGLAGR